MRRCPPNQRRARENSCFQAGQFMVRWQPNEDAIPCSRHATYTNSSFPVQSHGNQLVCNVLQGNTSLLFLGRISNDDKYNMLAKPCSAYVDSNFLHVDPVRENDMLHSVAPLSHRVLALGREGKNSKSLLSLRCALMPSSCSVQIN